MRKLVNNQTVQPVAPVMNWSISVPKSFGRHPLGGFSHYLNEIAIIQLTRRFLSDLNLRESPQRG